ncbi:MAG: four helix bundle protein [Chlorobi bacterium]|nr:four helix bundle protein [Chlorobiota bacterium]
MAGFKKFEEIEAWQKARRLAYSIFELIKTDNFNMDKRLRSQMNGSSGSIMDNIAEGHGRGGNKEFVQYLFIAKGSSEELRSQLYRTLDRKWIDQNHFNELFSEAETIEKMIQGLINYLQKATGTSDFKGIKYKNR